MYSMKTFISVLKLLLLTSITIGVPVYIYLRHPEFIEQFSTLKGVNDFLEKYQAASIFAYIGVQIAQVVISVIPGQFLQFAGGYAYGFWLGYLFAIIGIAIGSSIAFGLARVLGRDALHLLFGEERLTKFVTQLNSKRAFA
ncbi:MAG: VTT domain-containing protein, partial [Eubacteriales bacterium]|nr:VTT domain-containing protein [Eubacteriales bacterium]